MNKKIMLGILLGIFLLGILTAIPVRASIPDGMAYYPLEDGSGQTVEDSVGNYNGFCGGATWVGGKIGTYALDFEYSECDYVTILDHDNWSFTNGGGTDEAFSVTMWVNPESSGAASVVFGKYESTGNEREFLIQLNSGIPRVRTFHSNGDAYIGAYGGSSIGTGSWVHLAFTYSGGEGSDDFEIYIDGSGITETEISGGSYTGMSNTDSKPAIGTYESDTPGTTGADYDGLIDNTHVFNKRLTPTEAVGLYNLEANMLANPGFETESDWVLQYGAAYNTIHQRTGEQCVVIECGELIYQDLAVYMDSDIFGEFSFYAKRVVDTYEYLHVTIYYEEGGFDTWNAVISSTSYAKYTYAGQVDANKHIDCISIYSSGLYSESSVAVDDVLLVED